MLSHARTNGVVTSVDMLAPGGRRELEWVERSSAHRLLLPIHEQLLGLTGAASLEEAARQILDRGAGCVAVTRGSDGALVVTADTTVDVPAFAVDVVDTTGCGDAFSAGFLRGLALGKDLEGAGLMGSATAALVAQGLTTGHGDFDLFTGRAVRRGGRAPVAPRWLRCELASLETPGQARWLRDARPGARSQPPRRLLAPVELTMPEDKVACPSSRRVGHVMVRRAQRIPSSG